VVNVLEFEDLRDVVLVGHSYGTMVVTGAADRAADRLSWVVLLDGSIPENGKCLLDQILPERRTMIEEGARRDGDGWQMPAPGPSGWGIADPSDLAWMTPRLTPHLLKTVQQPISLTGAADRLPHAFINCAARPPGSFIDRFARQARERGWRYFELPCGHDAMILMPGELADALLSLV
jgi:pimeloyl-ACP methyl ester carboxylesterase